MDTDSVLWELEEHSKVKHDIIIKYLHPWIRILGKFQRICYFDCFSGPGEYSDGSPGSPLIAIRLASELQKYYNEFVCCFIERDPKIFENLKIVINREIEGDKEKYKKIKVNFENDEFANVISNILKSLEAEKKRIAPSFFFIDPFGVKGTPFNLIKNIFLMPRTEVFFTFMTSTVSRFFKSDFHKSVINDLFGSSEWEEICRNHTGDDRQYALKDFYINQLHKNGVKYVISYRINMEKQMQTMYYIIHATNNFLGFRIMKGIMYRTGMSGRYAYLGPMEGQKTLIELFENKIEKFKKYLLNRFNGQELTFYQVLEMSLNEHDLIDEHYKTALKVLENESKIKIERRPPKDKRGKNRTGISDEDLIIFPKV
jgi:three-Cys-motif partner protein